MKKLTALLLALCMLLAVVPALGEDFSGTWYMVLEDVTVGTLELNADGTFSLVMQVNDEANTADSIAETNRSMIDSYLGNPHVSVETALSENFLSLAAWAAQNDLLYYTRMRDAVPKNIGMRRVNADTGQFHFFLCNIHFTGCGESTVHSLYCDASRSFGNSRYFSVFIYRCY